MPENNSIWNKLCTLESLQSGWHLARNEIREDFVREPFANETFGYFSEENLIELLRILKTERYSPTPLRRVAIPKGSLGTRPGTILAVEDRVILFAALKLIAPILDKKLSDRVYSYRVKKQDKKHSLFYESDVISIPFLKSSTVKKYIDPFNPWYGLWPKFDELSKKAFKEEEFQFLAISDIAAYFENIQIDIMRELLNDLIPGEQKIINLFMTAFGAWTYDTEQGRRYLRGIPQGSQISSFFGNIFLKPIDEAFESFGRDNQIKYFRYMDDIRIFTKNYDIAREAILLLDHQIRRLHLNLQTAKTKIYNEKDREITSLLIDRRLNQVEELSQEIVKRKQEANQKRNNINFDDLIKKGNKIIQQEPTNKDSGEQKIKHARKPLKGLTDRVFRRLLSLYITMESDQLINFLLREIRLNDDPRYGKKLIQYGKHFPRKIRIQSEMLKFLQSGTNIFPYQEAQILEALRYQSRVKNELLSYCLQIAPDNSKDILVRAQALRLLSRCFINREIIDLAKKCFDDSEEISVKKAAALILIRQRGDANESFLQSLEFHPNEVLRRFGRLVRVIKDDETQSGKFQKHAFKTDLLMVDNIPLLYAISQSNKSNIISKLLDHIESTKVHKTHENMDMRDRLNEVLRFSEQTQRTNLVN